MSLFKEADYQATGTALNIFLQRRDQLLRQRQEEESHPRTLKRSPNPFPAQTSTERKQRQTLHHTPPHTKHKYTAATTTNNNIRQPLPRRPAKTAADAAANPLHQRPPTTDDEPSQQHTTTHHHTKHNTQNTPNNSFAQTQSSSSNRKTTNFIIKRTTPKAKTKATSSPARVGAAAQNAPTATASASSKEHKRSFIKEEEILSLSEEEEEEEEEEEKENEEKPNATAKHQPQSHDDANAAAAATAPATALHAAHKNHLMQHTNQYQQHHYHHQQQHHPHHHQQQPRENPRTNATSSYPPQNQHQYVQPYMPHYNPHVRGHSFDAARRRNAVVMHSLPLWPNDQSIDTVKKADPQVLETALATAMRALLDAQHAHHQGHPTHTPHERKQRQLQQQSPNSPLQHRFHQQHHRGDEELIEAICMQQRGNDQPRRRHTAHVLSREHNDGGHAQLHTDQVTVAPELQADANDAATAARLHEKKHSSSNNHSNNGASKNNGTHYDLSDVVQDLDEEPGHNTNMDALASPGNSSPEQPGSSDYAVRGRRQQQQQQRRRTVRFRSNASSTSSKSAAHEPPAYHDAAQHHVAEAHTPVAKENITAKHMRGTISVPMSGNSESIRKENDDAVNNKVVPPASAAARGHVNSVEQQQHQRQKPSASVPVPLEKDDLSFLEHTFLQRQNELWHRFRDCRDDASVARAIHLQECEQPSAAAAAAGVLQKKRRKKLKGKKPRHKSMILIGGGLDAANGGLGRTERKDDVGEGLGLDVESKVDLYVQLREIYRNQQVLHALKTSKKLELAERFARQCFFGEPMIKYGRLGKPHTRCIRVVFGNNHGFVIDWGSGRVKVCARAGVVISPGKSTPVFQREVAQLAPLDVCFSVIVPGARTLDLQTATGTERDAWVMGLRLLMEAAGSR